MSLGSNYDQIAVDEFDHADANRYHADANPNYADANPNYADANPNYADANPYHADVNPFLVPHSHPASNPYPASHPYATANINNTLCHYLYHYHRYHYRKDEISAGLLSDDHEKEYNTAASDNLYHEYE